MKVLSKRRTLKTIPKVLIDPGQEYERAVVYRLGRSLPGALRGPGIFIIVPCIDTFEKIDMRTPPQDVTTILKQQNA